MALARLAGGSDLWGVHTDEETGPIISGWVVAPGGHCGSPAQFKVEGNVGKPGSPIVRPSVEAVSSRPLVRQTGGAVNTGVVLESNPAKQAVDLSFRIVSAA